MIKCEVKDIDINNYGLLITIISARARAHDKLSS
jgi:hypothetical protein